MTATLTETDTLITTSSFDELIALAEELLRQLKERDEQIHMLHKIIPLSIDAITDTNPGLTVELKNSILEYLSWLQEHVDGPVEGND